MQVWQITQEQFLSRVEVERQRAPFPVQISIRLGGIVEDLSAYDAWGRPLVIPEGVDPKEHAADFLRRLHRRTVFEAVQAGARVPRAVLESVRTHEAARHAL